MLIMNLTVVGANMTFCVNYKNQYNWKTFFEFSLIVFV